MHARNSFRVLRFFSLSLARLVGIIAAEVQSAVIYNFFLDVCTFATVGVSGAAVAAIGRTQNRDWW